MGNLFKNHSLKEIEAAVAKGLSELVGSKVEVTIDGIEVKPQRLEEDHKVGFTVAASHERSFGGGMTETGVLL